MYELSDEVSCVILRYIRYSGFVAVKFGTRQEKNFFGLSNLAAADSSVLNVTASCSIPLAGDDNEGIDRTCQNGCCVRAHL